MVRLLNIPDRGARVIQSDGTASVSLQNFFDEIGFLLDGIGDGADGADGMDGADGADGLDAVNDITQAEGVTLRVYGDTVSVENKAKDLLAFGSNEDVDAGDGYATVWQLGKEAGLTSEIFVAEGTNGIDTVSSTGAGDNEVITIEGHVSDGGTGASENFSFVTQAVTLNGQSKVALGTPLARVSRAFVETGAEISGDVYVYEDTALSDGKPTDITKAHISIEGTAGETQSFKASATFSSTDYFFMSSLNASIKGMSGTSSVDFRVTAKLPGGVFRPVTGVISLQRGATTTQQIRFSPYVIVPKNSDIRVEANTNTDGTQVSAFFQGYLAEVVL